MNVIEAMAQAVIDYACSEDSKDNIKNDLLTALEEAERHGWRLVPVEPTQEIEAAIDDHWPDFGASVTWHQAIHAAPRPWGNEND
jgi:hypothetical protein